MLGAPLSHHNLKILTLDPFALSQPVRTQASRQPRRGVAAKVVAANPQDYLVI